MVSGDIEEARLAASPSLSLLTAKENRFRISSAGEGRS
jgi:hypothetical protein